MMRRLRKPAASTFRERAILRGWVGAASASQPVVEDRFLSIVTRDTQISLGHGVRITRIVHNQGTTLYHLADETIITAPAGARITWEAE